MFQQVQQGVAVAALAGRPAGPRGARRSIRAAAVATLRDGWSVQGLIEVEARLGRCGGRVPPRGLIERAADPTSSTGWSRARGARAGGVVGFAPRRQPGLEVLLHQSVEHHALGVATAVDERGAGAVRGTDWREAGRHPCLAMRSGSTDDSRRRARRGSAIFPGAPAGRPFSFSSPGTTGTPGGSMGSTGIYQVSDCERVTTPGGIHE